MANSGEVTSDRPIFITFLDQPRDWGTVHYNSTGCPEKTKPTTFSIASSNSN